MRKPRYDGIPKNTDYCYTQLSFDVKTWTQQVKYCRYLKFRKCGKKSNGNLDTLFCDNKKAKYGYYAYCKLLKRALSIGTYCKDCGIKTCEEC